MSRLPRLYARGCAHHIIQRGNNHTACFFEDGDRRYFLKTLSAASLNQGVAIHTYVLMDNHVHLLASPTTCNSCGRMMQDVGRNYVRYFNDRYERTGTLWEGRYKSTLVDSERYFLTVARYIEMNPVRAEMVTHPAEHRWSSYAANALGKHDTLVSPHRLYLDLGNTTTERQQRYQSLFDQELDPQLLDCLREATNKGWAFGSEAFKTSLQDSANRVPVSSGWGGDRRTKSEQRF
jgi:putative transposase